MLKVYDITGRHALALVWQAVAESPSRCALASVWQAAPEDLRDLRAVVPLERRCAAAPHRFRVAPVAKDRVGLAPPPAGLAPPV
ncbi:MAG: hypothetical protein AAGI08_09575 [Bacteroidota bacterium]